MNIREPSEAFWGIEHAAVTISNLALHPTKPMLKLPRSRWRRALLVLRGYELYGP